MIDPFPTMHLLQQLPVSSSFTPFLEPPPPMAASAPLRAPSWTSSRRRFEDNLSDLHKCTNLSYALQIHAQAFKFGLHTDLFVAPKLIAAFSLCREIGLAVRVFNQVDRPNANLYNTLIKAHALSSCPSQAFSVFYDMQRARVYPDNHTFPFLLKACVNLKAYKVVEMIHSQIEKLGFSADIFVPNSLIDTYCRFGSDGIGSAKRLFDAMAEKDVVSWNSILSGLIRVDELREARKVFDEMPVRDIISWNTILDGHVKQGDMAAAIELFERMPERNVVSWSTMVSGYSRAGDMEMARVFFDKMPFRNLVSWTIIISGYAEKGLVEEAKSLYSDLEKTGLRLDDVSYVSIVSACAESGFLSLGKIVHASIKGRMVKCSIAVSNALVDMYSKCGAMWKAIEIFENMSCRDLVSWNAMIQGLAMHGHGEKALEFFSRMEEEGIQPDGVTFVGLLCACTHMGYIDKGLFYFNAMEKEFGIIPQIEHYGCLIDLLGRGGRLKEAMQVVCTMPMEPNVVIWGTLLGACRMANASELAEEVLGCLIKLEQRNAGNLSMLSNVCADVGDWCGAAKARQRMKNVGTRKLSGASSIEIDHEVHEFTVFDDSHPEYDFIYEMIDMLKLQLKRHSHSETESLVL